MPPPPSHRQRRRSARAASAAAAIAICASALYGNVRKAPYAGVGSVAPRRNATSAAPTTPAGGAGSVAPRRDAASAAPTTPAGGAGGRRGGGRRGPGRAAGPPSTVERLSRGDGAGLMPPTPPWLGDYVSFHSGCTHVDPTTGRAALRSDPSCPFLVYRCDENGCAGLGGRIKSVMRCFYLAVMTRRVLLIDNPAPVPLRNFLEPNLVRWDASYVDPNVTLDVFNKKAYAEQRRRREKRDDWREAGAATSGSGDGDGDGDGDEDGLPRRTDLNLPSPNLRGYVVARSGASMREVNEFLPRGFPPALRMMRGDPDGGRSDGGSGLDDKSKRWQETLHRWGFWTLFKFSDAVLGRARELKASAGLGVGASRVNSIKNETKATAPSAGPASKFVPYVGVHLRTGGKDLGGWNDPKRHIDVEEWDQFLSCSLRFQRRMAEVSEAEANSEAGSGKGGRDGPARRRPARRPPIYVASDNADAKRYLRDLAREKRKRGNAVVYPPDLDIFHVAKSAFALVEGGDRTDAGGEGSRPDADADGEDPERLRRALFRGTLDAYAEIAVLADATCLIMSRSDMSFAAHFLGPERRCGAYVKDCINKNVVEGMYHSYFSHGKDMNLVERV